ncbi:MAG: S8 family serine peptidase [Firmicutes bacterium]|nr:S8 family serine peptidase [Bacillota bacterium]
MVIQKIILALLLSMQIKYGYVANVDPIGIGSYRIEKTAPIKDGDIKIAIIDTGVNSSNNLFRGINITSFDVSEKSIKPNYAHGTMVAGILVEMIRLTAPDILPNVEFISIRMGNENSLDESDLIRAIKKAITLDVDVINISACIYNPSVQLKEAVDKALAEKIIIVASVGNDCYMGYSYPACYDDVIAVTAVNQDGSIFDMANKNDRISVCAPGVNISTADPDNMVNYVKFTGTSAAAPFVTALVSIIRYEDKKITSKEMKTILEDTATDLGKPGKDNTYGYGLIDYKRALEEAVQQNELSDH